MTQYLDPAAWGAMLQGAMVEVQSPTYWLAVLQIIWINILLSGDNALVIAVACRGLQPRQRLWGMILGAAVAVALRIIFTGVIATLMTLPYFKLIGGLALLYIGAKMLASDKAEEDSVKAVDKLWRAIWIVAVADIIMSLDNVIAITVAAGGSMSLLVIGLGISIPLIVGGAALIMALDRFPIMVWAGGALLGWIAGDVIATDPVVAGLIASRVETDSVHGVVVGFAITGAVVVVAAAWLWRRARNARETPRPEAS